MKRGKKSREWDKVRARVKKEFFEAGRTFCELCGSTFDLTFAHRLKRRFINDPQELATVALLCLTCHQQIEILPHDEMYRIVTNIVEKRNAETM